MWRWRVRSGGTSSIVCCSTAHGPWCSREVDVVVTSDEVWEARRTSFGSGAANYAAGRPGYPREVVEACLPRGAGRVLDLAAGTGPLTTALLELGLSVVAVEPLDDMRAFVPAAAEAIAGTAEQIPLPDESVDAVFVGQAWHWFDVPKAVAECARVLRPGGTLNPMWNLLDASDPLSLRLSDIAMVDQCSARMLDNPNPPFAANDLFSTPRRTLTRYRLGYTWERVEAFIRSTSVMILAGDDQRDRVLTEAREAMPDGEFELSFICEAWSATKLQGTRQ
ncbi:MAG TPA: methyltransferase domain-containing protein [Mycobacteriales bacterium]|nr:methyltransferase domain-containing protein [Mycobacteriales bacterium]